MHTYTYDRLGNMKGDGVNTYAYDARGRLASFTDAKGHTTTYTYDSRGRRIRVEVDGDVTEYRYLGDTDQVAEEVDGQGNVLVRYTYDVNGAPLTLTHQDRTYYYHLNGHGDVVALTDESGQVVAGYR